MQNDSFKCVSIMRLIIEVKNPTEELTVHILFTLVVGYFATLNMTNKTALKRNNVYKA